ncbi:hypothetical protein CEXT_120571 [Caerostris extrusa]|uniref:Uncharacterized protein n=1 Tax=Caerostris extrusa TaxID=172846 RepID=A0AAV4X290_CAEEX|nr:hypothetical protein CEXT_120571 [Caerostris extrusa]
MYFYEAHIFTNLYISTLNNTNYQKLFLLTQEEEVVKNSFCINQEAKNESRRITCLQFKWRMTAHHFVHAISCNGRRRGIQLPFKQRRKSKERDCDSRSNGGKCIGDEGQGRFYRFPIPKSFTCNFTTVYTFLLRVVKEKSPLA